ncbi:MAG: 2-oxoacid:acceptor oxidoreductase family protein [Coriobacteriia bacterium]|nr:2-oxoacid:acceptor oxidoreductase family protein [Coriobacteriia bacterium]
MTTNFQLAGFGGQGVLFAAKVLTYAGLLEGLEVSWMPSYGPEMRGGTANCSVVLSEAPVGSPIVTEPDVLLAMNQPSFDKFYHAVVPGGICIFDSTFVTDVAEHDGVAERAEVRLVPVPASTLALDNDLKGGANVIMTGVIVRQSGVVSLETAEKAIEKSMSARHLHLLDDNLKALRLGYDYE